MRYFLFFCLFTGCLSSCVKEETISPDDFRVPATFVPHMGDLEESSTRVSNNIWSGNEIVGVCSVSSGGSLTSGATFKTYQPSGGMSGTRVQLVPTAENQIIYYPTDGSEVNFIAFSPYVTPSSNTVTYNLYDQASETTNSMANVDFIYHKGTAGYHQSNPVANLNFEHKLSRVVIHLTRASGYTASISNATVQLLDLPNRVSCNLSTGVVTASRPVANAIVPYRTNNLSSSVTFEGILAPHGQATYASRKIAFTVGGTTYSQTLTQDFESGKSYILNYEMTPTGIVLAGSTIAPWESGMVAWNNEYYVSVSESAVSLYKEASSGQLVIRTNYGNGSGDVVSNASSSENSITSCSWLTLNTPTGSNGTYTLNYQATAFTGSLSRTGFIHIQVGKMKVVVKVVQSYTATPPNFDKLIIAGEANCYMIPPDGSTLLIDIKPFVKYRKENDNLLNDFTSDQTFQTRIVWQDQSGVVTNCSPLVQGPTGSLVIQSNNAGIVGNALVEIIWSGQCIWYWHIWVTQNIGSRVADDIEVMNASLGGRDLYGRSDGLVYQWGRRTPFSTSLFGTYIQTEWLPVPSYDCDYNYNYRFCYGTDGWANTFRYDMGFRGEKNPCPEGWRVPTIYDTEKIINNSSVYEYSSAGCSLMIGSIYGVHTIIRLNQEVSVYAGSYGYVGMNYSYFIPNSGIWVDRVYTSSHDGVGFGILNCKNSSSAQASYVGGDNGYFQNAYAKEIRCVRDR